MTHLPTHAFLRDPRTGEPLRAIGMSKRGPIWPAIGAQDPPPPTPPAPPPPAPPAPTPPTPPPGDPVDPKKDPGPAGGAEALRADLVKEREKRKALEEQVKKLEPLQKFADALAGNAGGNPQPTQLDQFAARLEAQEAAVKAANQRALTAEIKVAASTWADPNDAVLHLGDTSRFLNDAGVIDQAAITAELAKVLEAKPYLAKGNGTPPGQGQNGTRRPAPDPGQGARGGNATTVDSGRSLYEQLHGKKKQPTS